MCAPALFAEEREVHDETCDVEQVAQLDSLACVSGCRLLLLQIGDERGGALQAVAVAQQAGVAPHRGLQRGAGRGYVERPGRGAFSWIN